MLYFERKLINPLLPSMPNMVHLAKISILIYEQIIKKNLCERRDYK